MFKHHISLSTICNNYCSYFWCFNWFPSIQSALHVAAPALFRTVPASTLPPPRSARQNQTPFLLLECTQHLGPKKLVKFKLEWRWRLVFKQNAVKLYRMLDSFLVKLLFMISMATWLILYILFYTAGGKDCEGGLRMQTLVFQKKTFHHLGKVTAVSDPLFVSFWQNLSTNCIKVIISWSA